MTSTAPAGPWPRASSANAAGCHHREHPRLYRVGIRHRSPAHGGGPCQAAARSRPRGYRNSGVIKTPIQGQRPQLAGVHGLRRLRPPLRVARGSRRSRKRGGLPRSLRPRPQPPAEHARPDQHRSSCHPLPWFFWRWIYTQDPVHAAPDTSHPQPHSSVRADVPLPDHHPSRYQPPDHGRQPRRTLR